jgi:hypothetical protein
MTWWFQVQHARRDVEGLTEFGPRKAGVALHTVGRARVEFLHGVPWLGKHWHRAARRSSVV